MTAHDQPQKHLRSIVAMLSLFGNHTSRWYSTQALHAFLAVAQEEGQTMEAIATAIHGKRSTVSRQLLDLGATDRNGNPGYGLIDILPHPLVPCANSYFLSAKGRRVLKELALLQR